MPRSARRVGRSGWWALPLALVVLLTVVPSSPAAALTPNERFVTRVYNDFFLRPPTSAELTLGTTMLGNGTPRSTYLTSLFQSPTWRATWIRGVYVRYLAREPSAAETSAADTTLRSGWNYLGTEADVIGSASYFQLEGPTNPEFLGALYRDVLFRDPDSSGFTYWLGQLNSGARTRQQVASTILRDAESAGIRVRGMAGETGCLTNRLDFVGDISAGSYCLVLDRMADSAGATYWIGQLRASGQLPSLWASLASSSEYWTLSQT